MAQHDRGEAPGLAGDDLAFSNETMGVNIIPFASMAGGWFGPLLMFWLYGAVDENRQTL